MTLLVYYYVPIIVYSFKIGIKGHMCSRLNKVLQYLALHFLSFLYVQVAYLNLISLMVRTRSKYDWKENIFSIRKQMTINCSFM